MKSIAMKLWVGMMTLVAVVLILLWLFQIVFLNSFYTQMRMDEIKNSGMEIIKKMGNRQEFENSLDMFAYNNNLTAELIDVRYNTIYAAGASGMRSQMPMMKYGVRTEAYEKVLQGETIYVTMTHPRFGSKFMLIGLPVITSGKPEGALVITLPLAPVEDTVNILKNQLVYITFILLGVTLLISYLISKSFTKPILDITKVSMDMASGNLYARIECRRKDEIGRLAVTINYMGTVL
jgi:methyl-accepting chemotaxis protein